MPGSLIYAVARKGEKHSIVTLGRELRSQRAANNRICWHLGIKAESSRDSREKVIKERERAFLYPLRWHHPLNLTFGLGLWDKQWLSQLGHCYQC